MRSHGARGEQNTPKGACPTEVAVKPQGLSGGLSASSAQLGEAPRGQAESSLMEQVVAKENMLAALKRVGAE